MLYYNQISQKQDVYALNFNGTNQFIQSTNVPQITQYNKVTFYFNVFIKSGNTTILTEGTNDAGPHHLFSTISTTFRSYRPGVYTYYSNALLLNQFNKITVTKNFNTNIERVFINGVFIGSNITNALSLRNPYMRIGFGIYSGYFNAPMKEISIASMIPTDAQIITDHATDTTLFSDLLQLKLIYPLQIQNSPNKVISTQGNEFEMINYPSTLVKGVDLIKL